MWDLVPWPGFEPGPSALRVWSLSHWTTREVPRPELLICRQIGFSFSCISESAPSFTSYQKPGERGSQPRHLLLPYFLCQTWIHFLLNSDNSLEKGRSTHSSILAWRISRTEGPTWLKRLSTQARTQFCQTIITTVLSYLGYYQSFLPGFSISILERFKCTLHIRPSNL